MHACASVFLSSSIFFCSRAHFNSLTYRDKRRGKKNELKGFFLCLIRLIFESVFKDVLYEASTDVEEITRSPDSIPFAFDELSLTLAANKNTCLF